MVRSLSVCFMSRVLRTIKLGVWVRKLVILLPSLWEHSVKSASFLMESCRYTFLIGTP